MISIVCVYTRAAVIGGAGGRRRPHTGERGARSRLKLICAHSAGCVCCAHYCGGMRTFASVLRTIMNDERLCGVVCFGWGGLTFCPLLCVCATKQTDISDLCKLQITCVIWWSFAHAASNRIILLSARGTRHSFCLTFSVGNVIYLSV